MASDVQVLIADDHRLVREALRALLRAEPGVRVVAEAEDGRSAVRLAAEVSPDVVVMDINMPDLNGIDATRQIRAANGHGPQVIALSAHSDPRYTSEMMKAGATGFVMKDAAFEELTEAIRAVTSGKLYLSPAIAAAEWGRCASGAEDSTAFSRLTPREREVLQLLAEGKAMKEAARHLRISGKTVETHRRNIMEKLDIDNVAELTKYAIREGLTSVHR